MCRIAGRLPARTLLGCISFVLLSLDGLDFLAHPDRHPRHRLDVFVLAAFGACLSTGTCPVADCAGRRAAPGG